MGRALGKKYRCRKCGGKRRLAVRWSTLLAVCFESFMKHDVTLRKVPVK